MADDPISATVACQFGLPTFEFDGGNLGGLDDPGMMSLIAGFFAAILSAILSALALPLTYILDGNLPKLMDFINTLITDFDQFIIDIFNDKIVAPFTNELKIFVPPFPIDIGVAVIEIPAVNPDIDYGGTGPDASNPQWIEQVFGFIEFLTGLLLFPLNLIIEALLFLMENLALPPIGQPFLEKIWSLLIPSFGFVPGTGQYDAIESFGNCFIDQVLGIIPDVFQEEHPKPASLPLPFVITWKENNQAVVDGDVAYLSDQISNNLIPLKSTFEITYPGSGPAVIGLSVSVLSESVDGVPSKEIGTLETVGLTTPQSGSEIELIADPLVDFKPSDPTISFTYTFNADNAARVNDISKHKVVLKVEAAYIDDTNNGLAGITIINSKLDIIYKIKQMVQENAGDIISNTIETSPNSNNPKHKASFDGSIPKRGEESTTFDNVEEGSCVKGWDSKVNIIGVRDAVSKGVTNTFDDYFILLWRATETDPWSLMVLPGTTRSGISGYKRKRAKGKNYQDCFYFPAFHRSIWRRAGHGKKRKKKDKTGPYVKGQEAFTALATRPLCFHDQFIDKEKDVKPSTDVTKATGNRSAGEKFKSSPRFVQGMNFHTTQHDYPKGRKQLVRKTIGDWSWGCQVVANSKAYKYFRDRVRALKSKGRKYYSYTAIRKEENEDFWSEMSPYVSGTTLKNIKVFTPSANDPLNSITLK